MRIREGEAIADVVPKLRAAADRAAAKLIDRVQTKDEYAAQEFATWFINLPEYVEFEAICDRLNEAVWEVSG